LGLCEIVGIPQEEFLSATFVCHGPHVLCYEADGLPGGESEAQTIGASCLWRGPRGYQHPMGDVQRACFADLLFKYQRHSNTSKSTDSPVLELIMAWKWISHN